MKLAKWDPFTEIEEMQKALWGDSYWGSHVTSLATDVYTENDNIVVEAHLPGFDKDEIDIDLNEGMLEIRAERHEKDEDKEKDRKYMMRETSTSFYRRIRLPKHADEGKIDAHLEDGLLKVTVPFKALPKPKKIAIKAKNKKK